jgi:hypothetical protein
MRAVIKEIRTRGKPFIPALLSVLIGYTLSSPEDMLSP